MNLADHLLGPAAIARRRTGIAFTCGDESVTYFELAAGVARAAAAFAALGITPGDRVLLLLRDTPEYVAAWLGAVRAGAVAIGLNTKLSEQEYRYICADSAARVSVVEDVFVRARPDLAAEFARLGVLAVAGGGAPQGAASWRELLSRATPDAPAYEARPEDPAFWLYSSGTTGKPKGIVHSHKDALPAGQVFAETLALAPGEKIFVTYHLGVPLGVEASILDPQVHRKKRTKR